MRHAAFLRGINLGGRRVKGGRLCALFEEFGFQQVSSFLASGNVVFDTEGVNLSQLADGLDRARDQARCMQRAVNCSLTPSWTGYSLARPGRGPIGPG